MNVVEKFCPVCKSKNEHEALICRKCGAALEDPFMGVEFETKTTDMPALVPEKIRGWSVEETTIPISGLAVYIEGESTPAYIDSRGEFILGRKMGKTSQVLLDLSPFGAYHLGLSRQHAIIRLAAHGYEVLDLGSVNGTWLNDERLIPHKGYPLTSGSLLRLGRMRVLVLYRPFGNTKRKP